MSKGCPGHRDRQGRTTAGVIGGTAAVSGGDMWVPLNRHIADQDSRAEAIAYVTRLSDGRAGC